jgi:LPXTG-site transpeptidase (sortase) family protein
MNLYSYKKDKNYKHDSYLNDNIILQYESDEKITATGIFSGMNQSLKDLVKTSKLAGIIIPLIFISTGIFFIYRQFSPQISGFIFEQNKEYFSQGTVAPVTDSYVNSEIYISNPAGFADLTRRALSENVLITDDESLSYTGTFYISIPSIGINRLPVEANVDSTTESVYNAALHDSLAHFKSTGLPISDIDNNIVIYGHSASPNYNPQKTDPEVAFSFLTEVKVGDDIIINMEGKDYVFKMSRSKIVKPDDTSIITGIKGKRTLTLFTCHPAGNDSQRYVLIAREV